MNWLDSLRLTNGYELYEQGPNDRSIRIRIHLEIISGLMQNQITLNALFHQYFARSVCDYKNTRDY